MVSVNTVVRLAEESMKRMQKNREEMCKWKLLGAIYSFGKDGKASVQTYALKEQFEGELLKSEILYILDLAEHEGLCERIETFSSSDPSWLLKKKAKTFIEALIEENKPNDI